MRSKMFLFAFVATFLALWIFSPLGWGLSLLHGLVVALVAALVEAVTPWRLDNLTVPLVSAITLYLLAG
jgi:phytol kinase